MKDRTLFKEKLEILIEREQTVKIYLYNGIKLSGKILSYDDVCICMEDFEGLMLVIINNIASIAGITNTPSSF